MKQGFLQIILFPMCLLTFMPVIIRAQLFIEPGSSVTIKNGTSLYVGTDLQIKSDNSKSGHFADQTNNAGVTISGDAFVERYLSANGWHNVSSPVSNARSDLYTGTDLVFYYDETLILNDWNFGWVFYNGPLSSMKGYDLFLPDSPVTVTYSATGAESLNTGQYSITVTLTDVANGEVENHKGWNLVGNPYPSPIDWLEEAGWDKSAINDAKYIWNPAANNYTIFLGGPEPIGINGGTRYIPSNQGFWVQATHNGVLKVNNRSRKGIMSATPDFYKNSEANSPVVCFQANGNGYSDQSIIRFIEGSGAGFDPGLDAVKFPAGAEGVPQISTIAGKNALAVNSLPQFNGEFRVPLNFRCDTPGVYSIGLAYLTSFDPNVEIYLYDKRTHTMANLKNDTVYMFSHDTANDKERFYVYFNPSEDIKNNISAERSFSVYTYHNIITIIKLTGKEVSGRFILYDLLGRCRFSHSLTNDNRIQYQLDLPAGYYIAHIESDMFNLNQKVRIAN